MANKAKSNGWKIFGISAIALLLAMGLGFGSYKLATHLQDNNTSTTEEEKDQTQEEGETTTEEEIATAGVNSVMG